MLVVASNLEHIRWCQIDASNSICILEVQTARTAVLRLTVVLVDVVIQHLQPQQLCYRPCRISAPFGLREMNIVSLHSV